jgi:hypothetical protein
MYQIGDRTHEDHNCSALMPGVPPLLVQVGPPRLWCCDPNETSKDILLSSFRYRIRFLNFFSGKNERLRPSTLVGNEAEIISQGAWRYDEGPWLGSCNAIYVHAVRYNFFVNPERHSLDQLNLV